MRQDNFTARPIFDVEVALRHPVLRGFCTHPGNANSVRKYINESTPENLEKLNLAFKRYFFAIRFTKYLNSLITNGRIDFVRKNKRSEERELVIFNKQISDEEEAEIGELLTAVYSGDDLPQVTTNPDVFQEQINNEWLYEGFSLLTSKQKVVITLAYSALSRDSEIALLLHVTQQAVSKTRKSALQKIRQCFPHCHQLPLRARR
ncbi:hypothetical protein ACFFSY_08300 [Paenibacillus aurantiacus]|uniref:Sigma-70 family RNA polymerase sigma factor n=1 Tax=Paenibacillus aurantiacus TaxID=1936118 RepID=A0ABV5KP87_9BACL